MDLTQKTTEELETLMTRLEDALEERRRQEEDQSLARKLQSPKVKPLLARLERLRTALEKNKRLDQSLTLEMTVRLDLKGQTHPEALAAGRSRVFTADVTARLQAVKGHGNRYPLFSRLKHAVEDFVRQACDDKYALFETNPHALQTEYQSLRNDFANADLDLTEVLNHRP